MKIELNEDSALVAEIRKAVKENGGFCCCAFVKDSSTKCMCEEFKEQIKAGIEGPCGCGLFYAKNE